MSENRSAIARRNAGISVGQAARILGITVEELDTIEAATHPDRAEQLAELYGVNVEWLTGQVERYDFERVRGMKGSEVLTDHDRKVIAEFAAAMPRNPKTAAQRLADVDARRPRGGRR